MSDNKKKMTAEKTEPKEVTFRQVRRCCGRRTDLAELRVTLEEVKKLWNEDIKKITDLWARVGEDPDEGISLVATRTKIEEHRLIEILAAQAVREAKSRKVSFLKRLYLRLKLALKVVVVLDLELGSFLKRLYLQLKQLGSS